jgi:hypothetical protein
MDVEHQYYTNTSGSCSIEQAVAKLLGWSKGPLFRKTVRVTEAGVVDDDLALVEVFEGGIDAQLESMLIDAQNQAIVALDEGATHDELSRLDKRIEQVMELVARVHDFRIRIDDELAKGQDSQLRIDRSRSDEAGMVHITLRSLDQWSVKEYGQSIFARPLGARSDQQEEEEPDEKSEPEMPSLEAKRVLIALALLQDLIVEIGPQKYKINADANWNAMAKRMSEIAKNQGISKQGVVKLRKMLAAADRERKAEASAKARRT